MKVKKIFAAVLALTMLLTMVTACGQKSTNPGTGTKEKTKIVYWHTYTDQHEEKLQELIDKFNGSQDAYEVVAEQQPYSEIDSKLMQAARNGTAPDLTNMYPSDAVNYIGENLLVDLAPYINDSQIGIPNFKTSIPAGQYKEITQWGDDKVYVFPCTTAGEVLFYNKTMFDKYGLTAPATWTELENCSKIIYEKAGISGFGTDSVTDTYQCLIMQAGSGYINASTKTMDINETIAKQKLNWFTDGIKAGYFRLVGEDQYFSGPFGSQAVASYIGSSAGASYVEAAVGGAFEVACVPIPQEGSVKYISSFGNNFACLSKDEAHARGAYAFLKFFTSTDNIVEWAKGFGTVPVYSEALQSKDFQDFATTNKAVKALTEEISSIGMLASVPGSSNIRTEVDKMVQSVALGQSDANTAYSAFITACQADLNK